MHFLFSVDTYDNIPSANGVCTKYIAQELIKSGHKVSVICQKKSANEKDHETIDGVSIYRIFYGVESKIEQSTKKHLFLKTTKRVRFFINLPFYPITNLFYANAIYKKALSIHDNNKIDAFVSVTQLVDHIYSGILFKKKTKNTKLFIYCLDALTSGYVSNLKKHKPFFLTKMRKFEIKALKKCDFFFAMESHKRFIENNDFYIPFKNKIVYTDIPLYVPRYEQIANNKKMDGKKIIYTGNMTYLDCEFIKRLSSALNNYNFLFVGKCNDALKKQLQECANITIQGPVSHEEIISIQDSADYFLAFDTSSASMIPGKIFEYFSTKKPVIFCSVNQNCSYQNYLDKYGNYTFIKTDFNSQEIKEALALPRHKNDNIEEAFVTNTPSFTAKIFEKKLISQ